jgi:hypothetical protein
MQLNYNSTHTDQNYLGRVFLFAKRNYWLFIIDIVILFILALPPYSWAETKLLLAFIVLLLIRDIVIFRISYKHLGKFIAKGNEVSIGILKGSKFQDDITEWLPDIEIEIRYTLNTPVLTVLSSGETLYKQYPVGIWTIDKMKEFMDSFYDYKKEQALWKIYKGQE